MYQAHTPLGAAADEILGDTKEPGTDWGIFDVASRDHFLAYVAKVNALGGKVTTYPYHGTLNPIAWVFGSTDTYGSPAARYPADVAAQFDSEPDNVESNPAGQFSWYLAPPNVTRWALSNNGMLNIDNMQHAGTDTSPPDLKPSWYDELKTALKLAAIVGVGLVALNLLQFVPKPRDWE